jgi:predicted MFS family arabinose efflux permease
MTPTESQQPISRYRWVVLFASLFVFVMFGYALQSVPPLLQQFQSIYGVDSATAGLLMSMVVIPGIVLALPAGILICRYSFRKLGLLSTLAIAVGSLIMALSSSFPLALFARFVIGLGGGLLSVGVPSVVPQWFQHKEMGRAMSVYAVGVPVATTAAFLTAPTLAQSFGWPSVFYVGALVSTLSAVFFWLTVRDGPLKGDSTAKLSDAWHALRKPEVWKVGVVWMLFNMVAIGFLTWAPYLFITFKGMTLVNASFFSSLIMISNFFFVPLYGWASDRLGRRKPFIIAGLMLMVLSLYAVTYLNGLSLAVSIVILGAVAGGVPPLVMAITAQILPPSSAGMGFGVIALWQNIGIAVTAPIIGFVLSVTQSLSLTFLGLSILAFIGAITAVALHSK